MIIIFRVPFQSELASFTRCLPLDSRLTRDSLKESIAEDVQQNETYNLTAVTLLAIEFFVAMVVGCIVAGKKYCCVRHTCGRPRTDRFGGFFSRSMSLQFSNFSDRFFMMWTEFYFLVDFWLLLNRVCLLSSDVVNFCLFRGGRDDDSADADAESGVGDGAAAADDSV